MPMPPMPTTRRWPQTLLLTALSLLIAAATIMLACNPAGRPAPVGGIDALPAAQPVVGGDAEPTATPTPDSNPKYPKLHAILQNLVQGFEAGNLTESRAAALAPLHYANAVLVTVAVAANIDAIDTWMERQSISSRLKVTDEGAPYLYAYVPVSLLGALSRQSGVTLVKPSVPPWTELSDYTAGAAGATGSSGNVIRVAGTPTPTPDPANPKMPEIPIWLKGANPYSRLQSPLSGIVYRYERGEITEAAAAAEIGYNYGSAVMVDIYVVDDPAKTDAIVSWLKGKNVTPNEVIRGHVIVGYIPVSVLGELSNQPGVTRILGLQKPNLHQESPEGPQGAASGPPTPSPTVCVQWESTEKRIEYCFTPEPEATPKYPNLSDHRLVELVKEFEKAQQSAGGVSGQSAEQTPPLIEVRVELISADQVDYLVAWLESQGVSGIDKGEVDIYAWVPVSLLGPMSEQDGVRSVRMPPEPVPTPVW